MGATAIKHAQDLFRVVASVYSADYDDSDAATILFSLANDEDMSRSS